MPTASAWDAYVRAHPHGHLLQTSAWGQLKSEFDWRSQIAPTPSGGALILYKPLPLGFTLAYVPRGPVVDWDDRGAVQEVLAALDRECRARGAICLKWEPDLDDSPARVGLLTSLGFRRSPQTVQPRRTILLDLSGSEADVLGRMKQKTRYNIGLAAKKDVTARRAQTPADLDAFLELMRLTGARDNFGVHAPEYYRRAYELFHPAREGELFLAEYEGQALAGVMAFAAAGRGWYFYGASSDKERSRMAPYLAQWEAIRWARGRGAQTYDLWGVPDEDEATLEAGFEQRRDGLWGVYRFKRGWGGALVRTVGAWDRVYNPVMYTAYLVVLRVRGISLG